MAKDDELLGDQISEDDLLDFDLDDLTTEDIHQDLVGEESDDDEIIELVDLVEKRGEGELNEGAESPDSPAEEHATEDLSGLDALTEDLSGESGIIAGAEFSQTDDDLDLSDLSLDSDLDLGEITDDETETEEFTESDFKKALGEQPLDMDSFLDSPFGADDSLENLISEEDLEATQSEDMSEPVEELEDAGVDGEIENMFEESDLDLGETVQTPIPDVPTEELFQEEDLAAPDLPEETEDIQEEPVDELETSIEAGPAVLSEGVSFPLSEEKIEAIISGTITETLERVARETLTDIFERVIRDTVSEVAERVIRETVADVAERVITEAIDALKQSLESETE